MPMVLTNFNFLQMGMIAKYCRVGTVDFLMLVQNLHVFA